MAPPRLGAYTVRMAGPSSKPTQGAPNEPSFAPHPDDEADVRAGLEEAERGELLSEEESAAYVRSLVGDDPAPWASDRAKPHRPR